VISFAPLLLYSKERAPGTHWIGGWVGPIPGLDVVENRKFLPLPGLELRRLGRPACSQSLYRLRYPSSFLHPYSESKLCTYDGRPGSIPVLFRQHFGSDAGITGQREAAVPRHPTPITISLISRGGVRLSPLGTSATNWPTAPASNGR
jgi:hypothetical protein